MSADGSALPRRSSIDKEDRMSPVGRAAEDILEAEAGGLVHVAMTLAKLGGALGAAVREWEHDDELPGQELANRCEELLEFVELLSLSQEGKLTLRRQCRRCSGKGETRGEDPCVECGGRGWVHAEDVDA